MDGLLFVLDPSCEKQRECGVCAVGDDPILAVMAKPQSLALVKI